MLSIVIGEVHFCVWRLKMPIFQISEAQFTNSEKDVILEFVRQKSKTSYDEGNQE